jgi:hypothetical protein
VTSNIASSNFSAKGWSLGLNWPIHASAEGEAENRFADTDIVPQNAQKAVFGT